MTSIIPSITLLEMVTLCSDDVCTGCGACENKCPHGAVTLKQNAEGFCHPIIDSNACLSCGLCIKACPMLTPPEFHRSEKPSAVFACWSLDETIRRESSSGGMFSVIAENILQKNGVVFGAAWNEPFAVKHTFVENAGGLATLRKSKYVQSSIGLSYRQAESFLKQNRPVLFVGSPCQIAGLYAFLGKIDDHLTTCDFICHGVPSPAVLAEYLRSRPQKIASVVHRTKSACRENWITFFSEWTLVNGKRRIVDDAYIFGFLTDIINRHGCMNCRFADTRRIGDFTLGDFWGLGSSIPFSQPVNKGVSLVMLNTEKSRTIFAELKEKIFSEERTLEEAIRGNARLVTPSGEHRLRKSFFTDFVSGASFRQLEQKYLRKNYRERISAMLQIWLGLSRYAKIKKMIMQLLKGKK